MRLEVIAEAINNISDEYVLEALELHKQVALSAATNMTTKKPPKNIVVIGVTVALILILGIIAFATNFFGTKLRNVEPEETYLAVSGNVNNKDTVVTTTEETESTSEEEPETVPTESETSVEATTAETTEETTMQTDLIYSGASSQAMSYDSRHNRVYFDGPSTCNEIEFHTNYLPDDCEFFYGDPDGWNDYLMQFYYGDDGVSNITLFYTPQFCEGGYMYFLEDFDTIEKTTIGEYDALIMSGTVRHEPAPGDPPGVVYSYFTGFIILMHPDGYIFVIAGTSMDYLEDIANGIEVRETGGIITYNPYDDNTYFIGNGEG